MCSTVCVRGVCALVCRAGWRGSIEDDCVRWRRGFGGPGRSKRGKDLRWPVGEERGEDSAARRRRALGKIERRQCLVMLGEEEDWRFVDLLAKEALREKDTKKTSFPFTIGAASFGAALTVARVSLSWSAAPTVTTVRVAGVTSRPYSGGSQ